MSTSSPLWTWEELAAASAGATDGAPPAAITGISIDTRTIRAGELFVALKDARDGHDFVTAAFNAGGGAALVAQGYARKAGDGALLRVDDPLRALERIGAAARARLSPQARVIAVTGSAGKTGTKEMLRACLATLGATHAPEKSFNNHWGVPLTLARMPADTQYAVIEIGMNHAGEIAPLARLVRPHVAIVTNVLPVHVGNFPDGETGVANAKAEIFAGLEPGGTAILPGDSPHFARLEAAAAARGVRVVPFGLGERADVRGRVQAEPGAGSRVEAAVGARTLTYRTGAAGNHIAANSLAVVAALDALGLATDGPLAALAHVSAPVGRGARMMLPAGGGSILLVDESYNANPASMAAAIRTAAGARDGVHPRFLAVIGDMLELGADAARHHRGLVAVIGEARIDLVFACGPNMKLLYDDLPAAVRGAWAPASAGLIEPVLAALRPGDVVMVKGSLGSRMAPIVDAIKSRFAAGASTRV